MKINGVIPALTLVSGNVEFSGGLWLDGRVIGDLTGHPGAASTLVISQHGSVLGNVEADTVVVYGEVRGSIRARHIEVQSTGRIIGGPVAYSQAKIEQGGLVSGLLEYLETPPQVDRTLAGPAVRETDPASAVRR